MDTVARLAAIVLGAVFVVAAVAKIVAGTTWVAQARELGAPTPVATALPWRRAASIGALLVTGVAAPLPAVAAALLLLVFSVRRSPRSSSTAGTRRARASARGRNARSAKVTCCATPCC